MTSAFPPTSAPNVDRSLRRPDVSSSRKRRDGDDGVVRSATWCDLVDRRRRKCCLLATTYLSVKQTTATTTTMTV